MNVSKVEYKEIEDYLARLSYDEEVTLLRLLVEQGLREIGGSQDVEDFIPSYISISERFENVLETLDGPFDFYKKESSEGVVFFLEGEDGLLYELDVQETDINSLEGGRYNIYLKLLI